MATPHIEAKKGDIARVVLMPGDPLRAKMIAETFLTDVVCFNTVRNMLGYTGYYNGQKVSVMASGMGMPSIGIYSYELYNFYDVEKIIRIGSAGAYDPSLKLYDVVVASKAFSESSFASVLGLTGSEMFPSQELNEAIINTARTQNINVHLAPIHSSDIFYHTDLDYYKKVYREHGCVCVEMESFALFANAMILNKQAACLLTISDSLVNQEKTTAAERQNNFLDMVKIALATVCN